MEVKDKKSGFQAGFMKNHPHEKMNQCLTGINQCLTNIFKIKPILTNI